MKAPTRSGPAKARKTGQYRSIDDAIRQKQATLLNILAGADLTRFTDLTNKDQGQPAGDNVSDVPCKEVK